MQKPVTSPQLSPVPKQHSEQVAAFMKLAARLQWEVRSTDELGIHLIRKKTYGSGYMLLGALTAIFVIGILVWIAGFIDYLATSDRMLFIPYTDLDGDGALKAADLLI